MTLQDAVVRCGDLPFRRDGANREIFLRPVARKQRTSAVAEHRVINRARVESGRPIELTKKGLTFDCGRVEDQLLIPAFEADGQEQREVKVCALVLPPAETNLDALLEARIVRDNRNLTRIREP